MFCICKENNKADSILPDIVRDIISRCILFSNQPNSLIMFIEKENRYIYFKQIYMHLYYCFIFIQPKKPETWKNVFPLLHPGKLKIDSSEFLFLGKICKLASLFFDILAISSQKIDPNVNSGLDTSQNKAAGYIWPMLIQYYGDKAAG